MAKLATLKPLVGTMKPLLAPPPRQVREQQRLAAREVEVTWHAWYKTARWQRLRQAVLVRDLYKCQRTGVLLAGKHPAPDSPVVDHKVPHRGNLELFWDIDNLQSVSKAYHDSVKQSMERGGQASSHPNWLRPSAIPLTIVCGAPASGKTSYVAQRAKPAHLVIDLDAIVADLSGGQSHGWDRDTWLNPAMFRRNDLIGSLSTLGPYSAAWLVVSEPKARFRKWWQEKVKPVEIVVIETPEAECIRRIASDPLRGSKATMDGIVRWWAEYDPRHGETVVRPA